LDEAIEKLIEATKLLKEQTEELKEVTKKQEKHIKLLDQKYLKFMNLAISLNEHIARLDNNEFHQEADTLGNRVEDEKTSSSECIEDNGQEDNTSHFAFAREDRESPSSNEETNKIAEDDKFSEDNYSNEYSCRPGSDADLNSGPNLNNSNSNEHSYSDSDQ